ncbi:MAG: hypothetical protein Tsb009_16160 [Planctomycetaceae bacterium]
MTDWSTIVEQHGPAVWNTIFRLVGREEEVADCFQETFLSAVHTAERETVVHWPALLKRIAISRSMECLRRRYRLADRLTVPLDEITPAGNMEEPADILQERELSEQLRIALAELEERQAHVFYRACLEEISYREIAEELGINVNYVGVLLNRARQILRKRLREFAPVVSTKRFQRETSS